MMTSDPISATGGNTNTLVEWAMKGALTNALGCAWFFAGYQLSVYKNERSHNGNGGNPAKGQRAQQRRRIQSAAGQQQQRAAGPHDAWNAAVHSIAQLLSGLNLPKDKYWQYPPQKYKTTRNNITTAQADGTSRLLTQCGKPNNPAQFIKSSPKLQAGRQWDTRPRRTDPSRINASIHILHRCQAQEAITHFKVPLRRGIKGDVRVAQTLVILKMRIAGINWEKLSINYRTSP
jgi:hypothetical protein